MWTLIIVIIIATNVNEPLGMWKKQKISMNSSLHKNAPKTALADLPFPISWQTWHPHTTKYNSSFTAFPQTRAQVVVCGHNIRQRVNTVRAHSVRACVWERAADVIPCGYEAWWPQVTRLALQLCLSILSSQNRDSVYCAFELVHVCDCACVSGGLKKYSTFPWAWEQPCIDKSSVDPCRSIFSTLQSCCFFTVFPGNPM